MYISIGNKLDTRPTFPFSTVCMAVAMTYVAGSSEPDSGTLNSVLVGDVTTGIKDVSIFTPPKSCLGSNKTKVQ